MDRDPLQATAPAEPQQCSQLAGVARRVDRTDAGKPLERLEQRPAASADGHTAAAEGRAQRRQHIRREPRVAALEVEHQLGLRRGGGQQVVELETGREAGSRAASDPRGRGSGRESSGGAPRDGHGTGGCRPRRDRGRGPRQHEAAQGRFLPGARRRKETPAVALRCWRCASSLRRQCSRGLRPRLFGFRVGGSSLLAGVAVPLERDGERRARRRRPPCRPRRRGRSGSPWQSRQIPLRSASRRRTRERRST